MASLSLAAESRAYSFSLAAASGVLLALSFPKFGHPALAWIALAPLLLSLTLDVSLLRAFALGLTTGVIYFAGTIYWISGVMAVRRPQKVVAGDQRAVCGLLALFPAHFM